MNVSGFQTDAAAVQEDSATFARRFDHTNLKPTSGRSDIEALCEEAAAYGFAAVCIAPRWVELAVSVLSSAGANGVAVCTVVGFPHGNTTSADKAAESERAIAAGAREVDMVISIGDLKDGNETAVREDIAAVAEAAQAHGAVIKTILETGFLERQEVVLACRLAVSAGADFVKTSTGFGPAGADPETVRLMRETVGPDVGVKAAGGIKTLADARAMLEAGASRLGCSSSTKIIDELREM